MTVLLYVKRRLRLKETPIIVRPSAPNGDTVSVKVWNWVDILVVRELFVDCDYRLPAGLSPSTILDLGANIGVSVRFFRSLFPEARVVAVEPDIKQFAKLKQSVGDDPGVLLVHAAATTTSGPVTFYEASEGWVSSLTRPDGVSVETTADGQTISDILQNAGLETVDLVKLDIEGGEWDLLEKDAIQSVTRFVVGELHHTTGITLDRARQLLRGWELEVHSTTSSISTFTASKRMATL